MEDFEDGGGVAELCVHVSAASVARRVQIARVGLTDEHAHVGVQVSLRGASMLPVAWKTVDTVAAARASSEGRSSRAVGGLAAPRAPRFKIGAPISAAF